MSLLLDESLLKIKFIFKCTGLHLEHKLQDTFQDMIKYRWLYIINFLWLNTDTIGEILWLREGVLSGKSFLELTFIAPCATICILTNIKSLFQIHNEDNIQQLLKCLRYMENTSSDNEDKEKRDKIIEEEKTFLMFILNTSIILNSCTAIAFSISPLLLMFLEYKKTGKVILMIAFYVVYPIDPYEIKYWPFVYLHQIWSAFLVALTFAGIFCLYYICCTSIRTQFRLLQNDIERIIPEEAFDENVFSEKFKKFLVRHLEIIRSVTLLETIYTKTTLFDFVTSSFMICLTCFNATMIDDIAFVLTFVSFMLMNLLQVFLLCFFGDMVMTSSMEVSNAMYNSNWHSVNAKTAKQLFVVQMRAQKPCKLTASGYADVNLRALTKILSTTWSYFALLKTIYSPSRG